MQMTISEIQKDTVGWLRYTALSVYKLSNVDFAHALHKVSFLQKVLKLPQFVNNQHSH